MFDTFLDPPVSLKDINELQLELKSLQIDNSRNVKRILENSTKQLEEMQKRYENPVPEVRTDFQNIKAQMMEGMKTLQKDSTSCLSQLSDMTQLIKQISGLVAQISYKVGFNIQAFQDFIFDIFEFRTVLRQLMLRFKHLSVSQVLMISRVMPLSSRQQLTNTSNPRKSESILQS